MPEFTIYVTGGGEYFYRTLMAVAMIFNNGALIWSVVMLGGMFAIISGAWYIIQKNIGSGLMKSHTFLEHGIIMVLVTFVAFVPTRVTVQDIYGQQNATPIDNVPLLISVPAAMFSGIGYDVFKTIDTTFQGVNGSTMTVSENGFVTPLKLMLAIRGGLEQVAPETHRSWINYVGSCTYNSTVTAGGLAHSVDLTEYLTTNGKDGAMVQIFLSSGAGGVVANQAGQYVTCAEAKTLLNDAMDSLFASGGATNPTPAVMRLVNMNMTESNRQNTGGEWETSDVEAAFDSFQLAVGASAQSAQQFMKNALMRNAVVAGYECGGNYLTAADQMLCVQAINDATQQYNVDAAGRGSWFSKMMLPAMTILQLLFFAFSVVAFLYGIIRGAGSIAFIGKYFLFGAWVFSWLPFVAIINAFINWMVTDRMNGTNTEALTLENYDSYFQMMQANLSLASDLLAGTPLITLGFLTGSMYAMSGFAQRLSSNDYVNEKNLAPNTLDVAPVMKYGNEFSGDAQKGTQTSISAPPSIDFGQAVGKSYDSAFKEQLTTKLGAVESFNKVLQAANVSGGSTTINDSETNKAAQAAALQFNRVQEAVRGWASENGFGSDMVTKVMASAGAGTGKGMPLKIGAELDMGLSGTESEKKAIRDGMNVAASAAYNFVKNEGQEFLNGITRSSTNSNTLTEQALANYQESVDRAEQASREFGRVDSFKQSIGVSNRMDANQIGPNLAADFARGPNGAGAARALEGYLAEARATHGEAVVNSKIDNYERMFQDRNMSFAGSNFAAQMFALNDLREYDAIADVAGRMNATSYDGNINAFSNQGIGANAANSAPVDDAGARSTFVGGDSAGAGHANRQSLETVKGRRDEAPNIDTRATGGAGVQETFDDYREHIGARVGNGVLDPEMDTRSAIQSQESRDEHLGVSGHFKVDQAVEKGKELANNVAESIKGIIK